MTKTIFAILLLLVPAATFAGTDCRIEDKGDHVELICVGDEKFAPAPAAGPLRQPQAAPVPYDRQKSQPQAAAPDDQPGGVAQPYSASRAFHGYVQKDQQRVKEFESKKAYRNRMIQEEMRRTPPPLEPQQPIPLDQ